MHTGKGTPLGGLPEPRGIFCPPGAHIKDARRPRKRQTRHKAGAQSHGPPFAEAAGPPRGIKPVRRSRSAHAGPQTTTSYTKWGDKGRADRQLRAWHVFLVVGILGT